MPIRSIATAESVVCAPEHKDKIQDVFCYELNNQMERSIHEYP